MPSTDGTEAAERVAEHRADDDERDRDDDVGEAHQHRVDRHRGSSPEMAPMTTPMAVATTPAMTITMSDCCAPRMTTAKMSRPTSS